MEISPSLFDLEESPDVSQQHVREVADDILKRYRERIDNPAQAEVKIRPGEGTRIGDLHNGSSPRTPLRPNAYDG